LALLVAATYYCVRLGFEPVGYKGLETGDRSIVSHAIRQDGVVFVFQSPLNPGNEEYGEHQQRHGDGV